MGNQWSTLICRTAHGSPRTAPYPPRWPCTATPLTELNRRSEHLRSTANVFELPTFCHYGVGIIGGPGLGAWRELADVERAVAYWGGGTQVRRRLEAGDEAADRACAMVKRELEPGISFMNARGLLHFDAHFENILTDGRRLYFTDYGLAISSGFELSEDESEFFARHESYDRCYSGMTEGTPKGRPRRSEGDPPPTDPLPIRLPTSRA
jgi:hypothetical protein